MSSHFPVIGYVGSDPIFRMMIGPALDLGVEFQHSPQNSDLKNLGQFARQCNVLLHSEGELSISTIRTLEAEGIILRPSSFALDFANARNKTVSNKSDLILSVLVARSMHNQFAVWTPTELNRAQNLSVTPAPGLSTTVLLEAQELALAVAAESELVGVMSVEMSVDREEVAIGRLKVHPTFAGNWTMDGSFTDQNEQHLRAILDLPLGETTMTSPLVVSAPFHLGSQLNMYRPYLHLMARSPRLKFHHYRVDGDTAAPQGHVTALGDHLIDLLECVNHAIDYMRGAINE